MFVRLHLGSSLLQGMCQLSMFVVFPSDPSVILQIGGTMNIIQHDLT